MENKNDVMYQHMHMMAEYIVRCGIHESNCPEILAAGSVSALRPKQLPECCCALRAAKECLEK